MRFFVDTSTHLALIPEQTSQPLHNKYVFIVYGTINGGAQNDLHVLNAWVVDVLQTKTLQLWKGFVDVV